MFGATGWRLSWHHLGSCSLSWSTSICCFCRQWQVGDRSSFLPVDLRLRTFCERRSWNLHRRDPRQSSVSICLLLVLPIIFNLRQMEMKFVQSFVSLSLDQHYLHQSAAPTSTIAAETVDCRSSWTLRTSFWTDGRQRFCHDLCFMFQQLNWKLLVASYPCEIPDSPSQRSADWD